MIISILIAWENKSHEMRRPQHHITKLSATLLDIVEIHQGYFCPWTFCLESSFITVSL